MCSECVKVMEIENTVGIARRQFQDEYAGPWVTMLLYIISVTYYLSRVVARAHPASTISGKKQNKYYWDQN